MATANRPSVVFFYCCFNELRPRASAAEPLCQVAVPQRKRGSRKSFFSPSQDRRDRKKVQERPPEEEDKYRILGALGRSQLGVVYRAKNMDTEQEVALTMLDQEQAGEHTSTPESIERFKFEMRAICKLRHPNIVPVIEATSFGEKLCVVADCVDGEQLDELLERKGPLDSSEAIQYFSQLATALDHIHSREIYHGRFKTGSVIIDKFKVPIIRDIAVSCAGPKHIDVATLGYCSPEVVLQEQIDERSDQFSLAVVAFECLCGYKPFRGQDYNTVGQSILNGNFRAMSEVRPELPIALDAVFERSFQKEREARYTSSQALVAAIATALQVDHPIVQAAADYEIIRGRRKRKQSDWDLFTIKALRDDMAATSGQSFSRYKPDEDPSTKKRKKVWIDEGPIQKQKKIEMYDAPKPTATTPGGLFDVAQEVAPEDPNALKRLFKPAMIKLIGAVVGVLTLLSGVKLFLMVTNWAAPSQEEQAAGEYASAPVEEKIDPMALLKEIDDTDGKGGPVTAPARKKSISEMTELDIRALLVRGEASDEELLRALYEAKKRSMPDLVSLSTYVLQSASPRLRIGTIGLLAESGDPRAVPFIVPRLDDPEFMVRSEAAKALGVLRDRRAKEHLIARLKKEEVLAVKSSITSALLKLNR